MNYLYVGKYGNLILQTPTERRHITDPMEAIIIFISAIQGGDDGTTITTIGRPPTTED